MSIPEMAFGHYQSVSISLRAALQPRAETFPFRLLPERAGWSYPPARFFMCHHKRKGRRQPHPLSARLTWSSLRAEVKDRYGVSKYRPITTSTAY